MKKTTRIFLISVALFAITSITTAQQIKAEQLYQQALYEMEGKGDYAKAIESFNLIITKFPKEKVTAAKALLNIGRCYEKFGKSEAMKTYERIINEYKDQIQVVAEARTRIAVLKQQVENGGPITRRILKDASKVGDILTPDGNYILRMNWETGDVTQLEIVSGDTTRIKNTGTWSESDKTGESYYCISNGKQIAYVVETPSDNKEWFFPLRIRNLDGSGLRTLCTLEKGSYIEPLDWSPDGRFILSVRSQNNMDELVLISVDDGTLHVLKNITAGYIGLSITRFSPDGKFIAFSSVRKSNSPHSDIVIMDVDGKNEVYVAEQSAEDQFLRWAPDGKSLVFLSDRSGTWDLWAVRVSGGKQQSEPELLKKDFGYNVWNVLGFAPNGSFYYKANSTPGGLYFGSVDLETGKITVPPALAKTRFTSLLSQPKWSPDGRNLMYISNRGTIGPGNNILTIWSATTGDERFLSPRLRYVNQISWAPDSRSIIAIGITIAMETGIFRINTETSEIIKLAEMGMCPNLCPDGKTLVFQSEGPNIMKRNLETGEESVVVKGGTMFYNLSPDGKEVVYQVDGTIKTQSLNGGEPRELFRGPSHPAWYYGLSWTKDGRYIIARARFTDTNLSEFLMIPAQGGTPLKLDLSVPKMDSFALHPDNRRFAYSVNEGSKSELWVMENFLPKARTQTTKLTGLTTRRILEDASKIGNILTADGKYIRSIGGNTGDVKQFEIAIGDTIRIKNKSNWSENEKNNLDTYMFSPDGEKLIYSIAVLDSTTNIWSYELRIRNLDGSELRTLYNEKEDYVFPFDWSPDGRFILSVRTHNNVDALTLISIADGSQRILKKITTGYIGLWIARFSPDGKFIAFSSVKKSNSSNSDILIINVDSGKEVFVAEHPAEDQMLRWTPDGKNLVFLSDRSGTWDLWSVRINDGKQQGEPQVIKKDFGYNVWDVLGFAPDGTFYYKHRSISGSLYSGAVDLEFEKIILPPEQVKTRYTSLLVQPSWSPDGKNLIYISNRSSIGPGNNILTIRSVENGEERFLSPRMRFVNQISWSPDSRSIIAIGITTEMENGIFRINTGTSEITKLAEIGMFPKLCPDGKTLVFAGDKGIMKRDLELGTESIVVKNGKMFYDLSPDGKAVVYHLEGHSIMIQSLFGGEPREIYNGPERPLSYYGLRWSRDGRYIIVWSRLTESNLSEIFLIPAQGGKPLKLNLPVHKMESFALHPDNKRFVYSVVEESKSELWVMENFLPKEKK